MISTMSAQIHVCDDVLGLCNAALFVCLRYWLPLLLSPNSAPQHLCSCLVSHSPSNQYAFTGSLFLELGSMKTQARQGGACKDCATATNSGSSGRWIITLRSVSMQECTNSKRIQASTSSTSES